jgi:hypothetical protein
MRRRRKVIDQMDGYKDRIKTFEKFDVTANQRVDLLAISIALR